MRAFFGRACFILLLAPVLAGCGSPTYVDNNGTRYLDANDMAVDTLERTPYTKNGVYYDNPEEATNTRDNRGMTMPGYGHDVSDDPSQQPPPTTTTTTTVISPAPGGTSTTTTIVTRPAQ